MTPSHRFPCSALAQQFALSCHLQGPSPADPEPAPRSLMSRPSVGWAQDVQGSGRWHRQTDNHISAAGKWDSSDLRGPVSLGCGLLLGQQRHCLRCPISLYLCLCLRLRISSSNCRASRHNTAWLTFGSDIRSMPSHFINHSIVNGQRGIFPWVQRAYQEDKCQP